MTTTFSRVTWIVLGSVFLSVGITGPARAQLFITPPNVGRGFTIEDFCSGFANTGPFTVGPIGIAFRSDGKVLVTDNADQNLYLLPSHADLQTLMPTDLLKSYGSGSPLGLAQILRGGAWHYYGTGADVIEIDPLTGNQIGPSIASAVAGLGIAPFPPGIVSPLSGHLLVNGISGGFPVIWDIDPVAKTKAVYITMTDAADGLTLTPDGTKILVASTGSNVVRAYDVASKVLIWTSPSHAGGYDGIALGLGTLDGYVYVNSNDGRLWEFGVPWGPHAGVDNLLADGGSRGDFIAVDPDVVTGGFPSLLLTQTDRITRIDPPGGGWFGPPSSTTAQTTTGVDSKPETNLKGLIRILSNPASGPATVEFTVQRETHVRLSVADVQGRVVAILADRIYSPGRYQAVWNGAASGRGASGIYFVWLRTGDQIFMQKMARIH